MSIAPNPLEVSRSVAIDPVGVALLVFGFAVLWVIWTVLIKPLAATPGHGERTGSSFPELVLAGLAIAYLIDWWRRHQPDNDNED